MTVPGDRRPRLPAAQLVTWTESLSLLLGRHLGLKETFTLLGRVAGPRATQALNQDLARSLGQGRSLYQALQPWKASFPPLFLGLVRVGELSGTLNGVMGELAAYLARRHQLLGKVLGALAYPALVLTVSLVGMALLSAFVLPLLKDVVDSLRPGSGEGLMANLVLFQAGVYLVLGFGAVLPLLIGVLRRQSRALEEAWERFWWGFPGVSAFWQAWELHNLAFAWETLLSSGYKIEEALEVSAEILGHKSLGRALLEASRRVRGGRRLHQTLRETKLLPPAFLFWIEIGEIAQDVTRSLGPLRSYYSQQLEAWITRIVSLAEPLLILTVGSFIMLVVFQFLGPIFTLMGGAL